MWDIGITFSQGHKSSVLWKCAHMLDTAYFLCVLLCITVKHQARTPLARLPWLFRARPWVLSKKNTIAADITVFGIFWVIFFSLKMVCCVYSLESSHWGDSNENTQHTFMLKKIKKISLWSLLTWCYNQPSLVPTSPCLELIFMVPKVFKSWKFDRTF